MINQQKTKKGDFVEIKFTGTHDGNVFDSNIPEDLKTLDEKAEPKKTIVVIGEKMVVPGLDSALEDKEINKEHKIQVQYKDGFGPRNRELVRTIPLSVFTKQKINPRPGATLLMDNQLVKIITISGARVITDFNNPLAGKDLEYKFSITRILDQDSEKAETLFQLFFRAVPEFTISQDTITVELPKEAEGLIKMFSEKFKKLMNKDLKFKELKPQQDKEETSEQEPEKTPQ